VTIQDRLIHFVMRANWILLALAALGSLLLAPPDVARGIIAGGLIVTVNFHLLSRTLKKALAPSHLASHHSVLAKYYIRFIISGIIIFVLISQHWVNPFGLFIGLSVVVASITLATFMEIKRLIFKEAV
jgi:hypothetical protein